MNGELCSSPQHQSHGRGTAVENEMKGMVLDGC